MEAAEWIAWRIANAMPTSVLRLGDGEFSILGYGNESPVDHTLKALRIWMGDQYQRLTEPEIQRLANDLRQAVHNANLIGIPRPSRQQREAECSYVDAIFRNYGLRRRGQIFTDSGLHHFLQLSLSFGQFLHGLPFLGLITPRDVAEDLRIMFSIGHMCRYDIPEERIHFSAPAESLSGREQGDAGRSAVHYPDRYEELIREIQVPFRGAVFLVGAGAFGKVYCEVIRRQGGIALDIGSLFDAWAGISSRRRIRELGEKFSMTSYAKRYSLKERMDRLQASIQGTYLRDRVEPSELRFLCSYEPTRLCITKLYSRLG